MTEGYEDRSYSGQRANESWLLTLALVASKPKLRFSAAWVLSGLPQSQGASWPLSDWQTSMRCCIAELAHRRNMQAGPPPSAF